MRSLLLVYLFLPALTLADDTYFSAKHPPHAEWGYPGQEGKKLPQEWHLIRNEAGELANVLCELEHRENQRQSPLDLKSALATSTRSQIDINYRPTTFAVYHNRHTVEFADRNPELLNTVKFEGKTYHLKQFHYHRPSEHLLDGKETDFEFHFVHAGPDKQFLVLGVFGKIVADEELRGNGFSRELGRVLQLYKGTGQPEVSVDVKDINLEVLLPRRRSFFTYLGSLTTPPCAETVTWVVFPQPVYISRSQMKEVTEKKFGIGFQNSRATHLPKYHPESQQLRYSK